MPNLLTVLRLANCGLSGQLPFDGWSQYLVDVDLSGNELSGGAAGGRGREGVAAWRGGISGRGESWPAA
jgi:hypothetical protein